MLFNEDQKIGRREVTSGLIMSMLAIPFTAKATQAPGFAPLWTSAQVLIGHSPVDQSPSPLITCPLFLDSGHFANAFHTLDLSDLPTTGEVKGTVTYHDDTIEPDFRSSVAAAVTQGSDGLQYLVVAGEGEVTGGTGYFTGVNKAIIRCKYKAAMDQSNNLLLIACVDCVVILVRALGDGSQVRGRMRSSRSTGRVVRHEVACLAVLSPPSHVRPNSGGGRCPPTRLQCWARTDCGCRLKPDGPRAPARFSRFSNRA